MKDTKILNEAVENVPSGEFDDLILADLIKEGYEGDALMAEFKARRARSPPGCGNTLETGRRCRQGNWRVCNI
ncbi:MAG: hypothetical protein IJQ99_10195 [Synergistaceae bacterium]|nr:hypothetical protein [Synergistaceae bacterium]